MLVRGTSPLMVLTNSNQTYIRGLEHLYGRLHSLSLCFGDYLTPKSQRSTHATLRGYLILLRHRTPVYSIHWQILRVIRPTQRNKQRRFVIFVPIVELNHPMCLLMPADIHRDNLHQIGDRSERRFISSLTFYIYYIIDFRILQILTIKNFSLFQQSPYQQNTYNSDSNEPK